MSTQQTDQSQSSPSSPSPAVQPDAQQPASPSQNLSAALESLGLAPNCSVVVTLPLIVEAAYVEPPRRDEIIDLDTALERIAALELALGPFAVFCQSMRLNYSNLLSANAGNVGLPMGGTWTATEKGPYMTPATLPMFFTACDAFGRKRSEEEFERCKVQYAAVQQAMRERAKQAKAGQQPQ